MSEIEWTQIQMFYGRGREPAYTAAIHGLYDLIADTILTGLGDADEE